MESFLSLFREEPVLTILGLAFIGNMLMAFAVAFFWQAKVILFLMEQTNKDLRPSGNWHLSRSQMWRKHNDFLFGHLNPELRRKWLMAVAYLAISWSPLFFFARQ